MEQDIRFEPGRGVYDTRRAAALSGVPARTLRSWAQKGIYAPSINPEPRTRLWSWWDLLAVRAIHWFRHGGEDGDEFPRVSMRSIRDMLQQVENAGYRRELLRRVVAVAQDGQLFLTLGDGVVIRADNSRQGAIPEMIELIKAYGHGPDLLRPRDHLRIIPGKLQGEPHVEDTRISTAVLYRLLEMGYTRDVILKMYPIVTPTQLAEALELEQSLRAAA